MEALNVANYIIDNWGDKFEITNLKLNKLVYYSQVESLRKYNHPLYDDTIEAWQYGPVEPGVFRAFSSNGRNCIRKSTGSAILDEKSKNLIDSVMNRLGMLSAFDLVILSHKPDGAWASVYSPNTDNPITPEAILASNDALDNNDVVTIDQAVQWTIAAMPNALRLLEDS